MIAALKQRPALAGAGRYGLESPPSYRWSAGARNPLRTLRANALRQFMVLHGGKVLLTPDTLRRLFDGPRLDRHDVERAAADLATAGEVVMRLAGETLVIDMQIGGVA